MRARIAIGMLFLASGSLALASEKVLQNDSVAGGGTAFVQAGFIVGDIGAAVLDTAPQDYPLRVLELQVFVAQLFGSGQTRTFDLHVYGQGGPNPGTPLQSYPGVGLVSGFLNVFDVSGDGIDLAQGPFTVGAEIAQGGSIFSPNLTTDTDGCQVSRNLIFDVSSGTWNDGCSLGIGGDLVIRAKVETSLPSHYGSGLAGTGGIVPQISFGGGFAHVGNAGFQVVGQQAAGGAAGVFVLGLAPASVPVKGGVLLTVPLATAAVTFGGAPGAPGAGSTSVPLPIPNNPLLDGQSLDAQFLVLDPGAVQGVAFTDGLHIVLTSP